MVLCGLYLVDVFHFLLEAVAGR